MHSNTVRRFREFLHALLDPGRDGTATKDHLMEAHYQQGPALLDAAAGIFSDPDRYPLTDEQYQIFAHIQNAVSDAMSIDADRNQAVIVVEGARPVHRRGPGRDLSRLRDHRRSRRVAHRMGATFKIFELTEQHRSGGSEAFEAWVDALVGGTPTMWRDEDNFTVRVAGTPQELERLTLDGDANSARLLAGP